MTESIFTQVQGIAADILNVSVTVVTMTSSPETLTQWDSLQHLNLVLALEQNFGVEFLPEEIEQVDRIELFVRLVHAKLDLTVAPV